MEATLSIKKTLSIISGNLIYQVKTSDLAGEIVKYDTVSIHGDSKLAKINKYVALLESVGYKKEVVYMNEYTDWSVKGVFAYRINFTK